MIFRSQGKGDKKQEVQFLRGAAGLYPGSSAGIPLFCGIKNLGGEDE